MSNIKIIDGVYINLDSVVRIKTTTCGWSSDPINKCGLYFEFSDGYADGNIGYKTESEANARVKQILEKQNNKDEIEI